MWGAGHGFWMPKLRIVKSRICRDDGGFGLEVKGFCGLVAGVVAYRAVSWREVGLREKEFVGLGWRPACHGSGPGWSGEYLRQQHGTFSAAHISCLHHKQTGVRCQIERGPRALRLRLVAGSRRLPQSGAKKRKIDKRDSHLRPRRRA